MWIKYCAETNKKEWVKCATRNSLPGKANMAFLKKMSTNVARAKQMVRHRTFHILRSRKLTKGYQAMAKIGQAESTVDAQFDQLESQFREQYSKMKKLTKFVQNYQTAIAGRTQQHSKASSHLLLTTPFLQISAMRNKACRK